VRRSLGILLAALAAVGMVVAPPGGALPALAADYELGSVARYEVRVDAGEIGVQVQLEFTNTTPDPAGQFSVFEELKLAIHDQAERVAARDDDGALEVAVAVEEGVNVATVTLREDLRYEDTVTLDLTYVLPDTDSPQLRVRPTLIVFPAWAFGTAGQVEVGIPPGYEVRVDGDPLTEEGGTLVSGPIDDPSAWLALVTAVRQPSYTDYDAVVPLSGGTADVLVRAFSDDAGWGERTRDLVVDALPLIEASLGLPYPRIGPLVLTEAVATDGSGFGEESTGGTEIMVAFDQPAFTALHQVAHIWLSPAFVESRWLREGLASAVAADVATELGLDLPYVPAERAAERADAAIPLDTWTTGADAATDTFGYAASWAFLDELEEAVGPDAMRAVLARTAASISPYQSASVDPAIPADGVTAPTAPLDTLSFLDHLEIVSGQPLADRFAETVLTEADAALLPARAEARTSFDNLVAAAGQWGAPDPVRARMTAWDFGEAQARIDEAAEWLEARDALIDELEAVHLPAPDRLQQAYRAYGGGAEAYDELVAERAVVRAYAAAADRVNAERSVIERIGLIGGPDPAAQLNQASGRFADGDLRGAVGAIGEAERIVASAATAGWVRILSAVLLAVLVLALAVFLVRRRSSYTAAP
jgi:hypothetical protein